MERFYYILTSFEVKIGLHIVLYLSLVLLGINFLRWKRKQRSVKESFDFQTPIASRWKLNFGKIHFYSGLVLYFLIISVLVFQIITLLTSVASVRKVTPSGNSFLRYNSPITVEFDVPVDTYKLQVNINPKLEMSVTPVRYIPFLPYARRITIQPKISYPPGETVIIYLSDVKNPLSKDFGSEHLLEYKTIVLPTITTLEPKNEAKDVPSDIEIVGHLTGEDTPQNIWEMEFTPAHPYTFKKTDGPEFKFHLTGNLLQNTVYHLTFFHTPANVDVATGIVLPVGEKKIIKKISFTTAKAPFVSSFLPAGDQVISSAKIEFIFDNPMNPDVTQAKFSLSPEISIYEHLWTDENTKLTITHSDFTKDTAYYAVIAKGALSKLGGVLEKDVSFSFRTLGKVLVANRSPSKIDSASINSSIRIQFNQEVHHDDAQKKFFITPTTEGDFTWEESTMVFKPKTPLKVGTVYTYKLQQGIQSVYGLDSDQIFEYSFLTGPQEFSLAVPYFRQEELFTCNIAAARQLLAYRGVKLSELQLKNEVGSSGNRGNGNPHQVHVPNYGTYWDPIYRGVAKYRPARIYKDWTLGQLLAEVKKGNPVMIWGQNGWSDPHEISWTNPDGSRIFAINGMHSAVVRGFRGPIENPTQILINDPWRGVYAIATGEFMRRWNFFKVAMVVD